ncbi:Na+/H+ antiporter NhaC [Lutispora saccharofermentans]|uniref:Na+/H+ antiporter NhaC n=2 Tax=root TaxID=1 RepID=A0ABT1NE37_9FIRM|nr:Na+/H+ antiporter NhaC [Lutispora saccharofermentans]MCQ1528453.1 Na+/H+ antiporter NhaC [Lutispora saccharofermentans]
MSSKARQKKEATVLEALVPVVLTVGILMYTILVLGGDVHIPLVLGSIITALIAVYRLGFTWGEIEEGFIATISGTMQAIIILAIIGMIIGTWILGGVVPTLIFYGLKVLSPAFFLIASMILCSIVSLATGSSWTTAGTVGIALMGVAVGLGVPGPMAAGAIISGAYFGDKLSPLSDTTNLAPAMAGSNLFDHIKHMFFTTGTSYVIALIAFGIMGAQFAGKELDTAAINELISTMSANFTISPILLLVPIIVITLVAMKTPAIPGLMIGTILGGAAAMIFQGASLGAVLDAMQNGVVSETGNALLDELLTSGGLQSMMKTISLIMCALTFGGMLEKSGMLETLAKKILGFAKSTGSLVTVTILSCIFVNALAGDQYLAIVLPGKMYRDEFHKRGLAPRNLSRCLEDAGTMTSSLIPWNTCGAAMSGYLGIPTVDYVPYAVLNLVSPIVSIVFGYAGITMMKLEDDPSAPEYKGKATVSA